MRAVFLVLMVGGFVACKSDISVDDNSEVTNVNLEETEVFEDNTEPEQEEVPIIQTERVFALECEDKGVDEYENPKSEVYLVEGNAREKVASCLACSTIERDDYRSYDIPAEAKSACGGWWAGGGDYFYAIQSESGDIEVYAGWQDEGQMEEQDTSFHWELRLEVE